jgi:uncharacterized membrane protein
MMVTVLVLTFLIGVVAGLRAMLPLALVAWGVRLNDWMMAGSHLAWFGNAFMPWVFSVLAIAELVTDKLPGTASRKVPPQFITRVITGALAGAVIGAAKDSLAVGAIAGAVGAVAGTLGGAAARGKLAAMFGKDLPAALVEDVVAIVLGIGVVSQV